MTFIKRHAVTLCLALIILLTFASRVAWQWDNVLRPEGVAFIEPDGFLHQRMADVINQNYPAFLAYDPYALYPGPSRQVGYTPMLAFITTTIGYIVSFGKPAETTLDVIAAFIPPVLGSLILIAVYFLGKILFKSRVTALIGTALFGFMPSEFFHRSLLGFYDHHILEVTFTVLVLLLLVYALERKSWRFTYAAGIALGLMHLAWPGSVILPGILTIWVIIKFTFDFWTTRVYAPLFWMWQMAVVFAISALIYVPYLPYSLVPNVYLAVFGISLLVTAGLCLGAYFLRTPGKLFIVLGILIVIPAIYVAIYRPGLVHDAWYYGSSYLYGGDTTIQEAQPLSLNTAIFYYGLCGVFALPGLFLAVRHRVASVFTVWAALILIISVGQKRFAYYGAVPVGLLSAYAIVWLAHFTRENVRKICITSLVALLFCSVLPDAYTLATKRTEFTPEWQRALTWLRYNTPEPFGDKDTYYSVGPKVGIKAGQFMMAKNFDVYDPVGIPENLEITPSYGVLSWWDYGHWIIRIGHRVPLCSNTWQISLSVSKFLTAQSVEDAEAAIAGQNVKFVVLDDLICTYKYYAIQKQATGSFDGWEQLVKTSMAYRLYTENKCGNYRLVHQEGRIKIYERIT